jgi:hypothetical protein
MSDYEQVRMTMVDSAFREVALLERRWLLGALVALIVAAAIAVTPTLALGGVPEGGAGESQAIALPQECDVVYTQVKSKKQCNPCESTHKRGTYSNDKPKKCEPPKPKECQAQHGRGTYTNDKPKKCEPPKPHKCELKHKRGKYSNEPSWSYSHWYKRHAKHCLPSVTKAPVAPDGTTAGALTDFVITLVDRNPSVEGLDLKKGATIEIVLPKGFTNLGKGDNSVILLQGWPQSPQVVSFPPPVFPWSLAIEGNTLKVTLTSDYGPGLLGPGPKQVHMILFGFKNPEHPDHYPIKLTIKPDPTAKHEIRQTAVAKIIRDVRPSINTVSLFSGPPPPPFFNPIYQTVTQGESARQVGFYVWDWGGGPFLGVDIVMDTTTRGRLVQGKRTVGRVRIKPPHGASSFSLETLDAIIADGTPEGPSELIEEAFGTGVPVGKLLTQFTPDAKVTGKYKIVFRLRGGNKEKLFVNVVAPTEKG